MQLSGHSTNNSLNTDPIPSPSSIGSVRDTSESLGANSVPAESSLSLSSNMPMADLFSGETDPVFRAWDRKTGIVIEQSQIVPAISITQSQISDGGTIVNDADLADYVPYTGATGDTDLGNNYLIADGLHINGAPIDPPTTAGVTIVYDLGGPGAGGMIFSFDFSTFTAQNLEIVADKLTIDCDVDISGYNLTGSGTTIEADAMICHDAPVNPTDVVNLDYVTGLIAGDISGLVPYTGAAGDVDLGAWNITTPALILDNLTGESGSLYASDEGQAIRLTEDSGLVNGFEVYMDQYVEGDLDVGTDSTTALTVGKDADPAETLIVSTNTNKVGININIPTEALDVVGNIKSSGVIKSAGSKKAVVVKAAAYTATINDEVIVCNSAVDFAITLPLATGSGQVYYIKNININTITLLPNGVDTIDAETTQSVKDGDCINIIDYIANKWAII